MKRKEDSKFYERDVITPKGTNETDQILEKLLIKRNGKYEGLLKCIANESILLSAFERILKKSDYYSKGIDDKNFFKGLSKELGSNSYQPKPSRKVIIPKSDGGSRPLGISCSIDKVVQEAMRFILELIYEPLFQDNSHGFRPNRSCHTAMKQYKNQFSVVTWVLNLDISKCFKNIEHLTLANILAKNINDRGFMDLYWKMVKAGYIFNGTHFRGEKGTTQGLIVSPILINIYLNELDVFINEYKLSFDSVINKSKNKTFCNNNKINVKEWRKLNIISTNIADKDFKRLFYIRYANDFIVGLDCDILTAKIVTENIKDFIRDILKMEIKIKHKQIINFRHNRTIFLGFTIKGFAFNKRFIRTNKQGVKFRVTPRPSILFPMKRVLDRFVEKGLIKKSKYGIKPTSLRRLIHYSLYNIIEYYNSIYRSLAYYYKICTFHSPLRNLNYILKTSCILTIALKMKLKTIHKVIKCYGNDLNINENNERISFVKWNVWKRKPKNDTKGL